MDTKSNYEVLQTSKGLVKHWTKGVPFEDAAREQLIHCANMPFIHKWVAAMPDVHHGKGATVGSVIPTIGAVIPAAVGVDIGCGMMALQTDLQAADLPDNLNALRTAIEAAVPHGKTDFKPARDHGGWRGEVPVAVARRWATLRKDFKAITQAHPQAKLESSNHVNHLGTLGTGNHFIEICLDENDQVWLMLHSGSRGVGNRIGSYFIELAKADMRKWQINLPDTDLAYLPEGTDHFQDYMRAVDWAQGFALTNREIMMAAVIKAVEGCLGRTLQPQLQAVNCHHNYVSREHHYGQNVLVTRKGAVSARQGQLGIIPGSMGARSFIVRGKGNPESFCSCSHGAGRSMSRTAAKKRFSVMDHERATRGVECRKDKDVIDETPAAYKNIDAVMAAQHDLVEVVHTLKQVVCVKG
ncbi:MAG: RtcB family protein [Leptospiraceae bacterium]|nr:RtcB family protein [Leptospiraceae bacterium]